MSVFIKNFMRYYLDALRAVADNDCPDGDFWFSVKPWRQYSLSGIYFIWSIAL